MSTDSDPDFIQETGQKFQVETGFKQGRVATGNRLSYCDQFSLLTSTPMVPVEDAAQPIVALAALRRGAQGMVVGVREDGAALGDETGGTIVMRLIELGFVPGESFEVISEHLPLSGLVLNALGFERLGDPMAVRIGGTCFALRRREAAAVMVTVNAP